MGLLLGVVVGGLLFAFAATTRAAGRQPNLTGAQATGGGFRSVPSFSRPNPYLPTRSPDAWSNALQRQALLDRIRDFSGKSLDIVPPTSLDRAADSPIPGYRLVPLGRKHNNRLCLTAVVGGTRGLLMIDTGTDDTMLSEATYRALRSGAGARLPAGVPAAMSINGTNVPLAQAPDFVVGKSNLGSVPVCLLPRLYLSDPDGSGGQGQVYDGLLGQNILRHYNAVIDCNRLMLYLDLDPAKKLDLAAAFARHGWTSVPMRDTGRHFLVPCVLNGRRYQLVVDTGSPFTHLDRSLLREARVNVRDLPLRSSIIGRDALPVALADLDRVQIGNFTMQDVHPIATAQSFTAFAGRGAQGAAGEPVVGLLGGDLLARNGAVIDFGTRMLYLKAPAGPAAKSKPIAER